MEVAGIREEEEEEEEEEVEVTSGAEVVTKEGAEEEEEDRTQVHSPCIRTWGRFHLFFSLYKTAPVQILWTYV